MKRAIVFLLVGILVGGGGIYLLKRGDPHDHKEGEGHEGHGHGKEEPKKDEGLVRFSEEARKAAAIKIVSAEKKKLAAVITATGAVRPNADRLAHVSPKVTGRVVEVLAVQGSPVKRGDPLVVLESTEMGEATTEFLRSKADLDIARINFEREEELLKKNATRGTDFNEAKSQHLRAQAAVRASRQKLLVLGMSSEEIDKITWESGAALTRVAVSAPLEGEVTEKHATLGEVVRPESPLFTISNLLTVWVELNLFQKDIRRVHPGQPVETVADGQPGKIFRGKVTYIGRVFAEDTRTFKARVELENPDGLLRPGMYVTAIIRDDEDEHVREGVAVPVRAVMSLGDVPVVFIAKAPGMYERRAVTLGGRFGDDQEILVGVEAGESVVTDGAFVLKSELLRAEMGHDHAH